MAENNELVISRVEDIVQDAGEKVVPLPGWAKDKPFVARLRRVSLLDMMRGGKVPNHLIGAVTELYQTGSINGKADKGDNMKSVAETMLLVAGASLVSPTLQELQEAGVQLTDYQVTQIYIFAMQGVDAMRPFRKKQKVLASGDNGENVVEAAKRVAADR
jgi:hypothetical protein